MDKKSTKNRKKQAKKSKGTPNFYNPQIRAEKFAKQEGLDPITFVPLDQENMVYIHIDGNKKNDDPNTHAWVMKKTNDKLKSGTLFKEQKSEIGRQRKDFSQKKPRTKSSEKRQFPPFLGMGLVLFSAKKMLVKGKKDEQLGSYVGSLSVKELIELQIDFVSFYHAILNHYNISEPMNETLENAKILMGYTKNDAKAFDTFNRGLETKSIALISRAAELAPHQPIYWMELIDMYKQQGNRSKVGEIVKKLQDMESELKEPLALFNKFATSYNSAVEKWKKNKLFSLFTQDRDIFTQIIELVSELSKWLKEGKCLMSTKELGSRIEDSQLCFEWISTIVSLAYIKVKHNISEKKLARPLKDSIETLLGFVPEPLPSIQTPNFLSPARRKKKWMDILGMDIFSFRSMESIKEARFVHIDGDIGNDDPESHGWVSKDHKIEQEGNMLVKSGSSETDAIITHIESYFGKTDKILHDTRQERVHIDTYIMPPTKDRDYGLLITCGMSQRPMNAPPGAIDSSFAELFVQLPPEWPLPLEKLEQNEYSWILQNIYEFAHFVHMNNTFYCHGQVMDLHRPLSNGTKMTGFIIANPLGVPKGFGTLSVEGGKKIYFLQFIPAYNDEMDYLEHMGWDALLVKFQEHGVTGIVDLTRENSCKRATPSKIEYATHESREFGFQVDYPNTWMVDDRPGIPGVAFVEQKSPNSGQFGMITSISTVPTEMTERDFQRSMGSMVPKYKMTLKNFEVVRPATTFKAPFPCHLLVGKGYQGKAYIQASIYECFHNKIVYIALFVMDINHTDEKAPTIEHMMKSLRFTKKQAISRSEMKRRTQDSIQSIKSRALKKNERFQTIDATMLRHAIESLSADSPIEEIHSIIEAFSYASISVDLKGFGEISHLLDPFLKKIKSTGLYNKLSDDMKSTLELFEQVGKNHRILHEQKTNQVAIDNRPFIEGKVLSFFKENEGKAFTIKALDVRLEKLFKERSKRNIKIILEDMVQRKIIQEVYKNNEFFYFL